MTSRISVALHRRLESFLAPGEPLTTALEQSRTTRIGAIPSGSPSSLRGAARASYLRRAVLDHHQPLIARDPASVKEKFEKLAESPFAFFRGFADLFYRDLAGTDGNLPSVVANGDVHPENFGVTKGGDGVFFFGLDDFDEAHAAPFTWDLRRGVAGIELATRERGFDDATRASIRRAFLDGYFDALGSFRGRASEKRFRLTAENAPEPIASALAKAAAKERAPFLEKLVDPEKGSFLEKKEVTPISERVPEFQAAIDAFLPTTGPFAPKGRRHFRVKDVAIKTGSGLGSIGLARYYVLIEGKSRRWDDDIVLELKEERPSLLQPYDSRSPLRFRSEGARVAAAEQIQLVRGDRYYGETTIDGKSYLVRERSPNRSKVDLEDLTEAQFESYAGAMGRLVAQAHARGDEDAGLGSGQIESRILRSTSIDRLKDELSAFAVQSADRTIRDHATFAELLQSGALLPNPVP